MPFFYVNIVTKGYDGALNLFFNDDIIALVDNIELADAIRKEISEKKKSKPRRDLYRTASATMIGINRTDTIR